MKVLLLGKTGQVGFELQRTLSPLGNINAPGRAELDLMDEQAVAAYLAYVKPGLIVNAAAWTAVDAAEEQRVEAERMNAGLPAQLAAWAKKKTAGWSITAATTSTPAPANPPGRKQALPAL